MLYRASARLLTHVQCTSAMCSFNTCFFVHPPQRRPMKILRCTLVSVGISIGMGGHSSQYHPWRGIYNFFFGTTQYSEHCWKEWIGDFYCDTVDVSNKWNARVVPSIYFELEIQLFKGLMISSLNSDHPFHSCCVCTRYFTSTFLLSALSVTNDEMAVVISMVGEQH